MAIQNTFDFQQKGPNVPAATGSMAAEVTNADGTYDRIFLAAVAGRRGYLGIRGKVAGNALTHMRLLRGMRPGGIADGNYTVVAEDADFATLDGTLEIRNVMPAAIHTTADGAAFDLILNCDGVGEYALEVKAAGAATVQIDYTVC